MLKKHSQFITSLFVLADIAIIIIAWAIAYYIRFSSFLWSNISTNSPAVKYILILAPITILLPFIFLNMGLYKPRRIASIFSEIFDIFKASSLAMLILVSATYLIRKDEFSRLVFLYFWSASFLLLLIERFVLRELLWHFRRKGYNIRKVLIVGAGELGGMIASKIIDNPWTGLHVIGFIDDYKQPGEIVEGVEVLGKINKIKKVIETSDIDQVIIALPIKAYRRLMYVVENLSEEMVTIRVVPDIYQAITLNAGIEEFEGIPLVNLTETPMYGWSTIVKRVADIVFTNPVVTVANPA